MSLPPSHTSPSEYFAETVKLLRKYQWLFSSRNTHILQNKLLDSFPENWCSILTNISVDELNKLPFGYFNENWPSSLRQFILELESLKPIQNKISVNREIDLPIQFFKGFSQKKIHEILYYGHFIDDNCKQFETKIIIDIGTGLGYLPQLLYKKYGYSVLGIESDFRKVEKAIQRQKEMYNDSIDSIKYITHFVNESSDEFLQKQINKYFNPTDKMCLIGLHACGDLSINLLKLFRKMTSINQAIVMPCCYHRLKTTEQVNPGEYFENFPLCKSLLDIYFQEEAYNFLTGAFLRLACQKNSSNWKEMTKEGHRLHSIGIIRRNVLQLVAESEGYQLSRLKRKTNISSETADFVTYLNNLTNTHCIINPKEPYHEQLINSPHFRQKMLNVWNEYEEKCPLMEVYSAFQASLQIICENIVLLDRVEMVKEWECSCVCQKVTDDSLSPRCYALVARKPNSSDS